MCFQSRDERPVQKPPCEQLGDLSLHSMKFTFLLTFFSFPVYHCTGQDRPCCLSQRKPTPDSHVSQGDCGFTGHFHPCLPDWHLAHIPWFPPTLLSYFHSGMTSLALFLPQPKGAIPPLQMPRSSRAGFLRARLPPEAQSNSRGLHWGQKTPCSQVRSPGCRCSLLSPWRGCSEEFLVLCRKNSSNHLSALTVCNSLLSFPLETPPPVLQSQYPESHLLYSPVTLV